MGDPPDKQKSNNLPYLQWDKTKKLNFNNNNDPIYMIMTRTNSNETLANVSPFLLKKAIDGTCGTVLECKKIRSGDILIKTKDLAQANKLITLTALSNNITIDIKPHNFLNTSKGVIYSNELRGITEEEILLELKPQHVIELKKIQKMKENTLTETGLIILTFQGSNLPNKINIGYSKVEVRAYIPPPMRCKTCLKYNHTAKFCKGLATCHNCGTFHTIDDNATCPSPTNCSNCVTANIFPANHKAIDKKCPIFIKEQELQAIKTTYKVDYKSAKEIYHEKHQHNSTTYATIAGTNTNTAKQTTKTNSPPQTIIKLPPVNTRQIISYENLIETPSISKPTNEHKTNNTIKILPRNPSKRLQHQLKKLNAKQIPSTSDKNKDLIISDQSDSEAMDY